MSYEQRKLFPQAEKLKLRNARVKHLSRAYFDRLWKKGYDPAYILEIERDDIPSIAEVWRRDMADRQTIVLVPDLKNGGTHAEGRTVDAKTHFFVKHHHAVVLSKGREDQDRRIVAIDEGLPGWIRGLYVALLQRQVREGVQRIQGVCYGTLTKLETDDLWQFSVDKWSQDLLTKRQF